MTRYNYEDLQAIEKDSDLLSDYFKLMLEHTGLTSDKWETWEEVDKSALQNYALSSYNPNNKLEKAADSRYYIYTSSFVIETEFSRVLDSKTSSQLPYLFYSLVDANKAIKTLQKLQSDCKNYTAKNNFYANIQIDTIYDLFGENKKQILKDFMHNSRGSILTKQIGL